MIHYTLLPEGEMRDLRREYRIRVIIVLLFFLSCSVIVGIISLLPSYMISSVQEKQLLEEFVVLQSDKKAKGIDITLDNLRKSNVLLTQLNNSEFRNNASNILWRFIDKKPSSIKFNSIRMANIEGDNENISIIVQGKANNREAVLDYKRALDRDSSISKVEFPTPDLTKSADISFAVKLLYKK